MKCKQTKGIWILFTDFVHLGDSKIGASHIHPHTGGLDWQDRLRTKEACILTKCLPHDRNEGGRDEACIPNEERDDTEFKMKKEKFKMKNSK